MKVFFDHNISPKMARAFNELFKYQHEVIALRDRFPMNVSDLVWIETLSKEDRWVVISGDRRITKSKTEYAAFRNSKLIGFFLSAGLHKSKVTKQAERILAQWDGIESLYATVKSGAVFELQMKGTLIRQLRD